MSQVKLIWATPEIDKNIAYMARVSNTKTQDKEEFNKLLGYLMRHGHVSPFEMANVCLEINTTRDIGRQILRHNSFSFQEFCISGDSLITTLTKSGKTSKVSISDLYKRYKSKQYWDMSDNLVRVFDEKNRILIPTKIKEVFQTGIKPVYELTLDNGKKIKSTLEHKFLTMNGFEKLGNIRIGDFVGSNGVPVYQSYDWLKKAKEESIANKTGVQGIADKANVSYHTIRKWLKKLELQFSYLESAQCNKIWNKGLDKELQPMYGKSHNKLTRDKMQKSSQKMNDSNLYSTGGNMQRSWRKQVADYWYKHKLSLYREFNGICAINGEKYSISELEIDHIKPVSTHPELAYSKDNIRLINKISHSEKTRSEVAINSMAITWQKVISVIYVGEEMTYDMEVEHESHNYIANGIVTHNSGRYAEMTDLGDMVSRECRMQDTKNRQNSLECDDYAINALWGVLEADVWSMAVDSYNLALKNGIAKEQARALLPEGLTPSRLYMNGNMRSWIFYLKQRLDVSTQKEHRIIAMQCLEKLREVAPVTMNAFFGEANN